MKFNYKQNKQWTKNEYRKKTRNRQIGQLEEHWNRLTGIRLITVLSFDREGHAERARDWGWIVTLKAFSWQNC